MKLLSLYIENYGKLSKTEYSFNSDLTVFSKENGYGKSTIASFIRSMFYGLPKASSVKFNDRVHFYPFNGGKFGGNLTFESQGVEYKIVRFFDKKSETKDEVKLYKNNEEVKPVYDNLGKFFFGLNENSFSKTVFLGDNLESSEDFSDITLKLTGLTSIDGDEDFKNAVSALESEKKKYRLSKGNNDIISKLKSDINELKEQIKGLETIGRGIGEKYEKKRVLTEILNEKNNELKALSKVKADEENYKTYQGYLKEVEDSKTKLESIKNKYPNGVLDEGEVRNLNDLYEELKRLEYSKNLISFDAEKEDKLNSYSKTFKNGVLTENDFKNIREDIDYVNSNNLAPKTSKNGCFVFLILSIVLLGVSPIFIKLTPIISVVFAVLGLGLGGVFAFLLFKANKNFKIYDNILKNCSLKRDKLQSFFKEYSVSCDDFLSSLFELKRRVEEYSNLYKERENCLNKISEIDSQTIKILNAIDEVFLKYNVLKTGGLKEQILALSKDCNSYSESLEKYNFNLKRASEFKKQRNVTQVVVDGSNNYDKIALEIDDLNKKIALIDGEIREDENLLEYLGEKKILLEELEEKLEKATKKHLDLSLALDYLLGAEKSLKDKYVLPLKTTFTQYSEKLEKALNEKVIIDGNFKMHFESGGEIRSSDHLSQGQKVLVDLCIRLALIDNMFKKESPFIVLDDPFATLDDNHLLKAKVLLKELAKDKQLIYFTCHTSREIS